jgi:hypothetical protein
VPSMSIDPTDRAKRFVRVWQRALRRKPTITESAYMLRAAELAVIAEMVRARVLSGAGSVDDLVRAEGAARRATRDMYALLPKRPSSPAPVVPPLAEMISRAREVRP